GLSLTLSMDWHCAQWTRTKVRPRCAGGDWARTGLLTNERNAASAMLGQRWPSGCVGAILIALCTRWRHGLQRFEIRHEIRDLSWRKLEQRHLRMDTLSQGPLQVLNGIFEMQGPEGRRDRERTFADCFDSMALRAMKASKPQTSPLRRRLCEGGFACT